jgi:hypothetical protein
MKRAALAIACASLLFGSAGWVHAQSMTLRTAEGTVRGRMLDGSEDGGLSWAALCCASCR